MKGDRYYHFNETASSDRYELLKQHAKELRNRPTDAERLLWNILKDRDSGYAFRQQHIIGDYIVDFVCLKSKLIVELDGGYHADAEQKEEDRIRENDLKHLGFRVIRFTNEDVFHNLEFVKQKILSNL